jgi:hypothetical protein
MATNARAALPTTCRAATLIALCLALAPAAAQPPRQQAEGTGTTRRTGHRRIPPRIATNAADWR